MKKAEKYLRWFLLAVCLMGLLIMAGCGEEPQDPENEDPDVIIIEQGTDDPQQDNEDEGEDDPVEEEPFPDLGEDTTVQQLNAALAKIDSFYYEQTIPYVDGSVFMQCWYKDQVLRVTVSSGGISLSDIYYDYKDLTQLTYYPGSGNQAVLTVFDPNSVDAPVNPKLTDYTLCKQLGFETIERQTCMYLEDPVGSQLWVSTKYGFPLKTKYVDSLGDLYEVMFKNIEFNSVSDGDITPPESLQVLDMTQPNNGGNQEGAGQVTEGGDETGSENQNPPVNNGNTTENQNNTGGQVTEGDNLGDSEQ